MLFQGLGWRDFRLPTTPQHWIPRRTPEQPLTGPWPSLCKDLLKTRPGQGEIVSMRLPAEGDQVAKMVNKDNAALGTIMFADGSQKSLAAFSVWLSILLTWRDFTAEIQHPQVVQLLSSLLVIKTTFKATEAITSKVDNTVAKIVKQNTDSRVQPVSSLQWASILMGLKEEGSDIKFDQLLHLYNQHPEVLAHSDKSADGGAGSILLDNRRKAAVKNWLERTCPEALAVVEASCHDIAFSLGAFGETMASYTWMFLGSTVSSPNTPSGELQPLDKEPYIHVDWSLPMNALAQTTLFQRVKAIFDRETATVPAQSKKKYRLSQENLQKVRNMICLWSQFHPHLETRLAPPDAKQVAVDMASNGLRDEDYKYVMEMMPAKLSLSMLPSSKAVAQEKATEREQQICLQVERQRMDVVEAQGPMEVLPGSVGSGSCTDPEDQGCPAESRHQIAPEEGAATPHTGKSRRGGVIESGRKDICHIECADRAQAAVTGYSDKYIRVMRCEKPEVANTEIGNMKDHIATGQW